MKGKTDWTAYEVLLPQPSYSKIGHTFEQSTSSKPVVRSILRSHAYERVVSVEAGLVSTFHVLFLQAKTPK